MIWLILKTTVVLFVVVTLWLVVQAWWKKQMGIESWQDPLATRLGCRGCHCHARCKDNSSTTAQHEQSS